MNLQGADLSVLIRKTKTFFLCLCICVQNFSHISNTLVVNRLTSRGYPETELSNQIIYIAPCNIRYKALIVSLILIKLIIKVPLNQLMKNSILQKKKKFLNPILSTSKFYCSFIIFDLYRMSKNTPDYTDDILPYKMPFLPFQVKKLDR